MKSPQTLLLQATLLFVLTSCTVTVPYTAELQRQYALGTAQLKRLQFYLSDPIVLYRISDDAQAHTRDGALFVKRDQLTEEVIIRPGTPGVVIGFQEDVLLVSFETGDDRYLVFGNRSGNGPYQLLAEEWTRGHGKLQYNGAVYFAKPGSGRAQLEVEMRKLRSMGKATRVVEGRRID